MAPQEFSIVVLSCPTYRVEFVISHHCHCYTGFAHGAGNPKNFALLGGRDLQNHQRRSSSFQDAGKHPPPRYNQACLTTDAEGRVSMTMNIADKIVPLDSH